MNRDGSLAHLLPFWREALVVSQWQCHDGKYRCEGHAEWAEEPRLASVYSAMVLGLRDYVRKNGFRGVVLGLSGGIDSALTAAVAIDALGADRVRGVRLPSRFTSQASMDDARQSARALGMTLETIPIERAVATVEDALATVVHRTAEGRDGRKRPGTYPRRATDGASPTSVASCSSPPATSQRCPWGTPRCMAICAAAIRCSRASTRPRRTRSHAGATRRCLRAGWVRLVALFRSRL